MRGRHGQRGWALLALFILLAASVVVDGGIEDYFIQQGAAIDAGVCVRSYLVDAAVHTDALIWCDCSLWIAGLAQNSAPAGMLLGMPESTGLVLHEEPPGIVA